MRRNKVVVDGSFEIFVVPNKAMKVEDFFFEEQRERTIREMTEIAEMNGKMFDPQDDKLVQLWWVGMGSENLCDHGAHCEVDGFEYRFRPDNIQRLPKSFFMGLAEGDTFELKIPARFVGYRKDANGTETRGTNAIINATVKLNQGDYRYRRFGSFEEVVESVSA